MNRYRFYMTLFVVVIFLFSVATLTVKGQGEHDIALERGFYEELEDDYVLRLREMLGNKGYFNAGITMTKIYQTDGSREYTVQIHHKRIDRLSEGEKVILMNELAAVCFGDAQCSILHKFLSYEE